MKKYASLAVMALLFAQTLVAQLPAAWSEKVAPEVRALLERGERADFLVVLHEQADLSGAASVRGKTAKAGFVFEKLRATAARTQADLNHFLHEKKAFANSFYLVNAIAVEKADLELARQIVQRPEVRYLAPDPVTRFPGPFQHESGSAAKAQADERGTIEWGVQMINAPTVWALGYTGQGITVGGSDTGYDWEHPALQAHYRGWNPATSSASHDYNWHDAIRDKSPLNADSLNPCGFNAPAPCDDNSHGTHTMGTMVGDDGADNQIGVAPGASWVGCRNMERGWGRPSSYVECLEWFLAPTDLNGQNPNVAKAPHVINNSWYCAVVEGCTDLTVNELLRVAIVNLKASGVVVVISNGNDGQNGQCFTTFNPPGYFEESFSVGATDSDDQITGFSSRGTVQIDGSNRQKPNVVAPGANVRSSVPGGNYAHFWGTSMAGPHVVGLVALLLSAAPDLAGEVATVEDIVETTAVPKFDSTDCGTSLGSDRPNHAYGYGRVNALDAVNLALSTSVGAPGSGEATATPMPNPVAEEAVFDLKNFAGKALLEVFDAAGQLVFSKNMNLQNRELVAVSLKNRTAGVYFWKITGERGTASGRLLKI